MQAAEDRSACVDFESKAPGAGIMHKHNVFEGRLRPLQLKAFTNGKTKLRGSVGRRRAPAAGSVILLLMTAFAAPRAQSQTLKTLHNFAIQPGDGATPVAGLIMDSSGNLYGTTQSGGSS